MYLCSVIYPNNFEHKLGFDEIRRLLKERCLSTLGKEKVDEIAFSTDCREINEWLNQVREFRRLKEEKDDFPMQFFFDVREAVTRIRMENTHLEEDEVWDLRRSLQTIADIVSYLSRSEEGGVRRENTHAADETIQGNLTPHSTLHTPQEDDFDLSDLSVKPKEKTRDDIIAEAEAAAFSEAEAVG